MPHFFDDTTKAGYLIVCDYCNTTSRKSLRHKHKASKSVGNSAFCNQYCLGSYKTLHNTIKKECTNCKCSIVVVNSAITNNNFCSKSCAATYNNKNKTHGTRRSKLEKWLEEQLTILYPDMNIEFNRKTAIGSELDIYFPDLKLAIELNGIFHFEPIYGGEKLSQIQNNDNNKFQQCQSYGISLCVIDTSNQKRFSDNSSMKFLEIIKDCISKTQST